jgi:hypothetical protein
MTWMPRVGQKQTTELRHYGTVLTNGNYPPGRGLFVSFHDKR